MPPGFGLLDAALVSVPIFLALLGLIRGAPVELASCCGCLAGVAAAWAVSTLGPVQALGQPVGPLVALVTGLVAWRLVRGLSNRLGLDSRWIDLGRIVDSVLGFSMGALRGVLMVSAACLAYAMIFVPLNLPNPIQTVAYPVFLAIGSQVTSAVMARVDPSITVAAADSLATVPLPIAVPHIAPPAPPPPPSGPDLSAFVRIIAPPAAAAPVTIQAAAAPDIPVRDLPVSLIETHHNILHPHGLSFRHARH